MIGVVELHRHRTLGFPGSQLARGESEISGKRSRRSRKTLRLEEGGDRFPRGFHIHRDSRIPPFDGAAVERDQERRSVRHPLEAIVFRADRQLLVLESEVDAGKVEVLIPVRSLATGLGDERFSSFPPKLVEFLGPAWIPVDTETRLEHAHVKGVARAKKPRDFRVEIREEGLPPDQVRVVVDDSRIRETGGDPLEPRFVAPGPDVLSLGKDAGTDQNHHEGEPECLSHGAQITLPSKSR